MLQALPPVFAGLEPDDVQEASGLLQPLHLEAGDLIMEQGEDDTTLAFIMQGVVSIMDGDFRISGAGARDVLGLPELFTGRPRLATVVAGGPVDLLVLAPESYALLCERGNPAVYNLERAALRKMSERLRYFSDGMAELTRGTELQLKPSTGLFHRLSKTFRGGKGPKIDPTAVLASSPLFDWADGAVLQSIGECFRVVSVDKEHVLCQQGEPAERMWVLASGSVDVVVMVGEGRGEVLATLQPGQAFGDASMALGTARSASCVCHEDVVALALDRDKYLELYAVDDPIGSTFRQGMCRNLVDQLMAAQQRFAALSREQNNTEEDLIRGTPISSVWRD
jgi:CRP-like cAMP-binding protein